MIDTVEQTLSLVPLHRDAVAMLLGLSGDWCVKYLRFLDPTGMWVYGPHDDNEEALRISNPGNQRFLDAGWLFKSAGSSEINLGGETGIATDLYGYTDRRRVLTGKIITPIFNSEAAEQNSSIARINALDKRERLIKQFIFTGEV